MRGALARREGKYEESIQEGQQALALLQGTTEYRTQARTLHGLGSTYAMSGDLASAERYFKQSLAVAQKHQISASEAQAHAGLANIAGTKDDYAGARQHNDRALAIYQQLGAEARYNHVLMNQALNYFRLGLNQKAEKAFRRVLVYGQKKNDKSLLLYCHANFPLVLVELHKLEEAEAMATLALKETHTGPDQAYVRQIVYQTLAITQEQQGRYRLALANERLSAAYADTIVNEERAKELVATETRFRTAAKQRQIVGLSAENERQKHRFWRLLAGTLGLAALVSIVAGLYWVIQRKNRQLIHSNRLVEERNQRITAQAHKLTLLMRELHHRVKNNLAIVASLLRLQSSKLTDEHAVQAVQESQQRVEAMALIHQSLYLNDDATLVDMHEYVHNLVNQLMRAYGYSSHNLQLRVEVVAMELDVDIAMPLGLILNELVTNTFKHALPKANAPALTIRLRDCPDTPAVILEVEDNGPGLVAESRVLPGNSFGTRLVQALVQQIRGYLKTDNRPGVYHYLRIDKAQLPIALVPE
ncbi:hypothetical protein GCM10022409_35890 [Hymenobacter glaciei]|uniref:histidine kinase n=2 Tax=Hymenobacter glaciei TaxID=877209 RepID=A0ABP7ULA4_9BACT